MRVLFKNSIAGSRAKENEDNYYIGDNYCVLLDGATSLTGTENVKKYTEKLIRRINTNYQESLSLKEIIKRSIEDLYLIYPEESPEACIVMMRENNDTIDFLSLGDCSIIYSDKHGDIHELMDKPNLQNLDKLVYKRMGEISIEQGITPREARNTPEIKDLLLKHRNMKNTKEGYYILNTNPKAVEKASTWTINKDNIDTVLLASDGLTEYYNEMKLTDCESFFYLMKLDGYYVFKKLREEQEKDPDLKNIRFKLSDDATGVMLKIN